MVYTYNKNYAVLKKDFLTYMIEDNMLSEISHSQKDKYCMIPFI